MLPLFYSDQLNSKEESLVLDEETSKHIVQVLRMKKHDKLQLTDGKGKLGDAVIEGDHKKRVLVRLEQTQMEEPVRKKITIALSLLKNANRFEWFLEKVTEIGVAEIIPTICHRTEREHFRFERMQGILISAMLQSRQVWLPKLFPPMKFEKLVEAADHNQKFIAHCGEDERKELSNMVHSSASSQIILVGPEGDFTNEEVKLALANEFIPVAMGNNRLRAETAGVLAAVLLKFH